MAEIYIPTEQYRAAVNAIAAKTGVDPDEIKIALGEHGNIWPASIQQG
jgi:3-oxoacyl-[acyl-carrier-protein] synthase III